jgi:amicoumacin kinase
MIPASDKVIEELCKQHGIKKECLQFLGGGNEDSDGIAYLFESKGKKKVLKILSFEEEKKQSLEAFEERIRFAHFLGESGVRIAFPKALNSSELYSKITEGKYIFVAYVMDYIEGKMPETIMLTTEFVRSWGKLIGRTHKLTKQYPIWKNLNSNRFEFGYQDEIDFFQNWCKEDSVKTAWIDMKKIMDDMPKDRDCYGVIHNDNHQRNIIAREKDITLIDIDCITGQFFLQDITVPAQGIMFDLTGGMYKPVDDIEPLKKYFDYFINGYEQECHLDSIWLEKITTFINYRRLLLFTVMQDYLNTNAPLKDSFLAMIKEPPEISIY